MIVAKTKAVLKKDTRSAAAEAGISRARVGYASVVLTHAPDLAESVISGSLPLDKVYAEARARKLAAESTEGRMKRLRDTAPDFADLVVEERMTLPTPTGSTVYPTAAATRR